MRELKATLRKGTFLNIVGADIIESAPKHDDARKSTCLGSCGSDFWAEG